MSTHSPGPWSEDPEGEVAVTIEDANGNVVCDVHGAANDSLCEANWRLIAAAPELLEALTGLLANAPAPKNVRDDFSYILYREAATVAIAKAKGQS